MVCGGEQLYQTYCGACHLQNGKGDESRFPPLDSSEYVMGDKDRLIGILLNGLHEPITVKGKEWNSVMPSHGFLTDEQLSLVLSYVRKNFGHNASEVSVAEVTAKRSKPAVAK